MNNIFSPQEMEARRQFHRLFCTNLLHTCAPSKALHDSPWDSGVLWDILQHVYENNPLTPDDIETIVQISGMINAQGDLWFTVEKGAPLFKEFIVAISPYITNNNYVILKMRLGGTAGGTNVPLFYQDCCTDPKAPYVRVRQLDAYRLYEEWCRIHREQSVNRKTFRREFELCGVTSKKGYLEGKCGQSYYSLHLTVPEEKVYEPKRTTPKYQEEKLPALPQVDFGRGSEDAEVDVVETETRVPILQEPEVDNAAPVGDVRKDETVVVETLFYDGPVDNLLGEDEDGGDVPDSSEEWEDTPNGDDGGVDGDGEFPEDFGRDEADDGAWDDNEYEDSGSEAPAEAAGDGAKEDAERIKAAVRSLPKNVREFFKLMKITYLVNPMNFRYEDFEDYAMAEDILTADPTQMKDLFTLFLSYAQIKE